MYDYNNGEPERLLTKDDFLDNVTLYWLTNSATSSARLYWETSGQSVLLAAAQKTAEISLPVAITVFPEEVYRAPETWARRAYRNLIYFHEVDKGGHFAAWEAARALLGRTPSRVQITSAGTLITKFPLKDEGGPHENDTNHGGSGADRRKRFGAERAQQRRAVGARPGARTAHLSAKPSPSPRTSRSRTCRGSAWSAMIVDYPPGASSAAHRHARSAFIYAYVLSGEIRSQVDDEPARVYRPGETWFESPGAHHRVSANASDTEPARLLAVFIVDAADEQLAIPDPQ